MTPIELLALEGQAIEALLRKDEELTQSTCMHQIHAVLKSLGLVFDWSHSCESFEDFTGNLCPGSGKDTLHEIWARHEAANDRFREQYECIQNARDLWKKENKQ